MRLIDENGDQAGVLSTEEALTRAQAAGLDLVEVAPNANPPVCKILDYGKYKFQQQKKASEAKKKQVVTTIKEITLRPRTEENDLQIKLRNVRKFLARGDKVKFNMRFRGREITHKEIGMAVFERIKVELEPVAKIEQMPKMDGRVMVMVVVPDGEKAKQAIAE